MRKNWTYAILPALFSAVALLALHESGSVVAMEGLAGLVWPVLAAILIHYWDGRRAPSLPSCGATCTRTAYVTWALAIGLVLYLSSSASFSRIFFFLPWNDPSQGGLARLFFTSGPARACWMTALFMVGVRVLGRRADLLLVGILVTTAFLSARAMLDITGGLPIYKDDHPSFLFRFWELGKTLPGLVNYNPYWNGGRVSHFAVPTGAVAPGLLLFPFWKMFPPDQYYTQGLLVLFLVIVPAALAWAARIAGAGRYGVLASAILAMGVSRYFFVWFLNFGTVGACTTMPLIAVVAAGLFRLVHLRRSARSAMTATVVGGTLMLCWPANIFAVPPLLVALAGSLRSFTRRRLVRLVICAVALALLCLPIAIVVLQHSNTDGFAGSGSDMKPLTGLTAFSKGWKLFTSHLVQAHPLILFFGFAGCFFFPSRRVRKFFIPLLLTLALIAGWGKGWRPKFDLVRFGIPMCFVAILPCALWLDRILKRASSLRFASGLVLALLLLGGFSTAQYYGRTGTIRFHGLPDQVKELCEVIRREVPENGRVLFLGSTIHGYGGGHVAPLPIFTGREMMASDYYHFHPAVVDYQFPPKPFRDTDEGLRQYLDLYNVTHVVTSHKEWKFRVRRLPELFSEVHEVEAAESKYVFRVLPERPGMFLLNGGKTSADINALRVTLDDPSRPAAIRYNWDDGLEAGPGVKLFPFKDAASGLEFIGLDTGGQREVVIRYGGWW